MAVVARKPDLTDEVDVPAIINLGLACPAPEYLGSLLGNPRSAYSQACQSVTSGSLASLIQTASVGPFVVTGLRPAVDSLRAVFNEVRAFKPDVYRKLGTAGMLCCRKQRGSNRISGHSWGTAIDLKLDGKLDVRGNSKVHYGLTLVAPIFNRHGWFWGATFRVEDAMHFEVSKSKLQQWKSGNLLALPAVPLLKRGATGDKVRAVQDKLKLAGVKVSVDGDFGPNTEDAVKQFQLKNGLAADGVVGRRTLKALGLG